MIVGNLYYGSSGSTTMLQLVRTCYVFKCSTPGCHPLKKMTVRERELANGNQQIPGYKFCYTKNIPSGTRQKSCRQRIFSCPVTWMKTTLLIPSYHIFWFHQTTFALWEPCIMLKLNVLRCLPAKEILKAGSIIQGFRAPFSSKCGPERLRVFQAKSWLSVTHLWNYDWFLVVCSRRWMKSNKNRHRSQEQQQQCRWGLEQHPPTTCCYLFDFYSFPHIAWFSTRAHKFRAWNSKMATQVCRRSDHLRQPLTYLPGKSRDGQIFGGPGCREVYMTPAVPRPTSQNPLYTSYSLVTRFFCF